MIVRVFDIKWDKGDTSGLPKEICLPIRDGIDDEVDETIEEVIEACLLKKFKRKAVDFTYSRR